jgi:hypothetical protein
VQQLMLRTSCFESKIASRRATAIASSALSPRARVHVRTARRESIPSLQHRVAKRRLDIVRGRRKHGCQRCVVLSRVNGSSFPHQSGRSPSAPPCAVRVAARGGFVPAGHQEISQWPTRC